MKRSPHFLLLICILAAATAGYAGNDTPVEVPQPDPVLEAWRWQYFAEADDLASVRVVDVAVQDSAVWFATDRGVSRYDGVAWTTYTEEHGLSNNDVRAIAFGPDGTVWAGTASGVSRLDSTKWVTLQGPPTLAGQAVNDLVVGVDGGVWVATDTCAARWADNAWQVFTEAEGLPDHRVNGLALAPDGSIWFATERGAARYDGSSWRSYRQGQGLLGPSVTSVFASNDGAVWFAQYGVGLSRLHNGRWTAYRESDGLPDAHVRQVAETRDGTIWALCRSGIARSEAPGGPGLSNSSGPRSWTAYPRRILPGLGEPFAAGVDPKGALWIGGRGSRGLARFDYPGDRWTEYHLDRVAGSATGGGIGQTGDGILWFGADRGALRLDGEDWTRVRDLDGPVRGVYTDGEGAVFLFGRDGEGGAVYRVGRNGATAVRPGLGGDEIHAVCRTRDRSLWAWAAGSRKGLLRWREGASSWEAEAPEDPKLPSQIAGMVAAPDGSLWIAGRSHALYRRSRGGRWERYAVLRPDEIHAILASSDGSLWIAYGGGGGGLTRLNPDMTTAHYTVHEGLVHDEVHALCEGRNGTVLAGTSGGVSCFDGVAWVPLTGSPLMDVRTLFVSRDGALWIRTASGNAFRYWNDGEGPKTRLDDAPASVSAEGNVSFAWDGRDRWSPVSMPIRFSYRLDGADWTPFSDRIRTPLFSLPDGPHTFEVRAQDPDLNIEPTPAVHRFVVEAPLWKQPWLLALVGILVAAVAMQTRRILARDRALGRANQELNALNEELRDKSDALETANVRLQEMDTLKTDFFSNVSHELRTPMTAIKGYIDNLLDRIPGPLNERQDRYLTRMRDNTDRLTRLINDLLDLSRIDRGRTDLLQLSVAKIQVRSVVAEIVEGLRPVADESMLKLTMTGDDVQAMADRDRLAQVVTNLVHNAIKFTDAGGEVAVEVRSDGEGQVLTSVRDTGRGVPEEDYDKIFDRFYQVRADAPRQAGTGLGLPIAKELVELQGGKIWVESEVGVGSTFTFTLSEVDA